MALETIVIWLVVGAIAGWLASQIMKGGGLKLTGTPLVDYIITGVVGAVVGGWLLGALGVWIGGGVIGAIINAVIGAIVVIFLLSLIKR
jgi:uncharacterized membrane protein YeaQ/YmgE (transglycosylase-associated protein family)